MRLRTIVLAKVTNTGFRFTGDATKRDGNYFPEFVVHPEPKACVWLNQGSEQDLINAGKYAKENGFEVFTFCLNEPYPLRLAKNKIMKMFEQNRVEITTF
jgi:hypothetical protein